MRAAVALGRHPKSKGRIDVDIVENGFIIQIIKPFQPPKKQLDEAAVAERVIDDPDFDPFADLFGDTVKVFVAKSFEEMLEILKANRIDKEEKK